MIRAKYIARLSITLACISAMIATAYTQPLIAQRAESMQSHLYQVNILDEKTGRKKFGFINSSGKLVIDYDRLPESTRLVGDFQNGLALIQMETDDKSQDRVGFIDETGQMAIEPRFFFARSFSDGMAFAARKGFIGFIDQQGREVIGLAGSDPYGSLANDFHEGLAAVGSGWSSIKWGYIDRSGKLVIDYRYRFADEFSEGLAGVVDQNGMYGFINRKGMIAIDPQFEPRRGTDGAMFVHTSRFREGLAVVNLKGLYGYVNSKGDFVIPPQFGQAQEFSEGLAWVITKDHKIGWIDKAGQWVVTTVDGQKISDKLSLDYFYELEAWKYSEGLVAISVHSKDRYLNGYMDRRGAVVIEPREIYQVGRFVGGIARVFIYTKPEHQEEKMGYIDKTGQLIWPPKK